MSNEKELRDFLVLKDQDILKFYDAAQNKLKKSLDNIYKAAYRYALTDSQTLYLLKEAIKPYMQDLMYDILDE